MGFRNDIVQGCSRLFPYPAEALAKIEDTGIALLCSDKGISVVMECPDFTHQYYESYSARLTTATLRNNLEQLNKNIPLSNRAPPKVVNPLRPLTEYLSR